MRTRFARWLRGEDQAKEHFLAEIGGSHVDEAMALERVNRDHADRHSGETVPIITEATVRTWARDDPEFALALRAARQFRDEGRRIAGRAKPEVVPPGDTRFIRLEDMTPAQWQAARWQSLGRRTESIDPGPAGRLDK